MPTVEPGGCQRVLVTGANGYIASWVVRTLLEQGYTVRGAVRSNDKGKRLSEMFSAYSDKFESIVVKDITKDGAFDEALKGVDAVEHMASPLTLLGANMDLDHYIIPAVQGTLGILKSALKLKTQVKRIVITSSVGAIFRTVTQPPVVIFDESDWNDEDVQIVKEKGKDVPEYVKYQASKTLSERAAWDFYHKHKAEIGWDLVVLNPPLVLGPPLQDLKNPADLNLSLEIWYQAIFTQKLDALLGRTYGYIDVRDIAAAHVESLKKKEAGGERIIISEGTTTWQDTRDLLFSLRPELYTGTSPVVPRGNPDLQRQVLYKYNGEKGKTILGIKYRSIEESTHDTTAYFEARGWVSSHFTSFKPSLS